MFEVKNNINVQPIKFYFECTSLVIDLNRSSRAKSLQRTGKSKTHYWTGKFWKNPKTFPLYNTTTNSCVQQGFTHQLESHPCHNKPFILAEAQRPIEQYIMLLDFAGSRANLRPRVAKCSWINTTRQAWITWNCFDKVVNWELTLCYCFSTRNRLLDKHLIGVCLGT